MEATVENSGGVLDDVVALFCKALAAISGVTVEFYNETISARVLVVSIKAQRALSLCLTPPSSARAMQPLIDLLDSRHLVIGKRYYRDSCTRRDGGSPSDRDRFRSNLSSMPRTLTTRFGTSSVGKGAGARAGLATRSPTASTAAALETVKDLSVVDSEHFPQRTVIVDNQPRTVLQQANVLPVRSWFPKDSEDRQLLDLLPVLLALTSCQDVRSVLGLRPGVGGARAGVEPAVESAAAAASGLSR